MSFAADHSCQNVLQLHKKNLSLEKNSSVLCKSNETPTVTSLDISIASRPFG